MIKRTFLVLIAALALGASGMAATPASATVVPKQGHYSGHDNRGNKIGFRYSAASGMNHFTIDYTHQVGGAGVDASHWGKTCHVGICTEGIWSNSTTAQGHWINSRNGHIHFWTAYWVRNPNAGVTH